MEALLTGLESTDSRTRASALENIISAAVDGKLIGDSNGPDEWLRLVKALAARLGDNNALSAGAAADALLAVGEAVSVQARPRDRIALNYMIWDGQSGGDFHDL